VTSLFGFIKGFASHAPTRADTILCLMEIVLAIRTGNGIGLRRMLSRQGNRIRRGGHFRINEVLFIIKINAKLS
jgi:hypothetical protein